MDDLPTIWSLVQDYHRLYATDAFEATPAGLKAMIEMGQFLMITAYGYAQGAVVFDNIQPGLHASIGTLVRPDWLRGAIKADVFGKAIDAAFERWGLLSIMGWAHEGQTQAIRLLKRYKFSKKGNIPDFCMVNDEPKAMIAYQLRKEHRMKDVQNV